jgi:uncharacterized protein (TIGR03067 family)
VTKYVLAALVISLLLGAEEKNGDAKKDQEALQGTWRPVSSEQDGKDQTAQAKEYVFTFDRDTFTMKKRDQVWLKGTFKLDPSQKPKTIDMTATEGRREDDKGKELHGIYELDKGTLKWCTSPPGGKDRPKDFATKEGTRFLLVTLKKDEP